MKLIPGPIPTKCGNQCLSKCSIGNYGVAYGCMDDCFFDCHIMKKKDAKTNNLKELSQLKNVTIGELLKQ